MRVTYTPLALAKKHLQVEESFLDDDAYIAQCIAAAEEAAEREICHSLADHAGAAGELPAGLQQGVLLLVGQFYANREPVAFGVSVHEVPRAAGWLLNQYRDFAG